MLLPTAQSTDAFGRRLASLVQVGDVITLSGALGAGKTSIARGLLSALGLPGEAPSPSYAIVQPYDPPEVRLPVLHVDLYRIDDPADLDELGLDDSRWTSLLLVEWAEHAGPDAWPDALRLTLSVADGGGRVLTAQVPPGWEDRWSRI
ncbi:tRNA threonylcarbamoyladenosine biosynthesis protein TsaE [Sphingomonas sp. Leaf33]|uniref:tRNA (adenosine(37)-N6)-threonylcarbamoyltransferase complex ATPase subunit type 1 TsaE n=1 Tax=Sphingomonas sp. Leaf33 TaxID=1736215 RepID=UPI0006F391A2|nr:tRNA (adenosine(37)-N6)-threonylcarbamoyltransferase complex ATPase subunit type 1 TsaE [Sphingomonas sp. Leaf33]KQN26466.1 tRNA threonylcarbamoyladenosine biosynthesis protein TsaE [Sphingomonas sp. Leaf33]